MSNSSALKGSGSASSSPLLRTYSARANTLLAWLELEVRLRHDAVLPWSREPPVATCLFAPYTKRRSPLALTTQADRVEDRCTQAVLVLIRMHRLGLLEVTVARAQRPVRGGLTDSRAP